MSETQRRFWGKQQMIERCRRLEIRPDTPLVEYAEEYNLIKGGNWGTDVDSILQAVRLACTHMDRLVFPQGHYGLGFLRLAESRPREELNLVLHLLSHQAELKRILCAGGHGDLLTWNSLLKIAALAEEYNLEWAIASYDWGS